MSYSPGDRVDTTVVGVTYNNRQAIVSQLQAGSGIRLVREPDNPADANAIRVEDSQQRQCGYLKKELAAVLAPLFDQHGQPVAATVIRVSGGFNSDSNYGVNIAFTVPGRGAIDSGHAAEPQPADMRMLQIFDPTLFEPNRPKKIPVMNTDAVSPHLLNAIATIVCWTHAEGIQSIFFSPDPMTSAGNPAAAVWFEPQTGCLVVDLALLTEYAVNYACNSDGLLSIRAVFWMFLLRQVIEIIYRSAEPGDTGESESALSDRVDDTLYQLALHCPAHMEAPGIGQEPFLHHNLGVFFQQKDSGEPSIQAQQYMYEADLVGYNAATKFELNSFVELLLNAFAPPDTATPPEPGVEPSAEDRGKNPWRPSFRLTAIAGGSDDPADEPPVFAPGTFDPGVLGPVETSSEALEEPLEQVPTAGYPYPYPFDYFNPVQSRVLHLKDRPTNVIVAANTSAGKTVAAELLIDTALAQGRRAIYLSPLKALTEEKYTEWQSRYSNEKITILTGDYELSPETAETLRHSTIVVMTSEMMDSRSRKFHAERNEWMQDVGIVVVDESHILSTSRGDAVETGIMRFTSLCPDARIVFLSATMSNADQLAQWLTALNGKQTDVVQSAYRPVPLQMHYYEYDPATGGDGKKTYRATETQKIQMAVDLVLSKPDEKFLVFVHAKTTGRKLAGVLQKAGISTAFHNADLRLGTRRKHEASFRDRDNGLRVLVSTSTMAWGVNLPARNVVIVGVHRGLAEVDELDIIQMSGRAGRYNIDTEGHVHLILPPGTSDRWRDIFENPRPVISVLANRDKLAFHVLAEIQNQAITTEAALIRWYGRSLTALQKTAAFTAEEARAVLMDLKKMKMIVEDAEGYSIAPLGRVSALLYFRPDDVFAWYKNFARIIEESRATHADAAAWALADIPSNRGDYLPGDLQYLEQHWREALSFLNKPLNCGAVFWIQAVSNCLEDIPAEGTMASKMWAFRNDAPRIINALRMIDQTWAHWHYETFWDFLEGRLAKKRSPQPGQSSVPASEADQRREKIEAALSILAANGFTVVKKGAGFPAEKCEKCGGIAVIQGTGTSDPAHGTAEAPVMKVCFECKATFYVDPKPIEQRKQDVVDHMMLCRYTVRKSNGGEDVELSPCPTCGAEAVVTGCQEIEISRGTHYEITTWKNCFLCGWQTKEEESLIDDYSDISDPPHYEDEQERLRDKYGEGGFETDEGYFFSDSWDPS